MPMGEGPLRLMSGFLKTLPCMLFPFIILALYPLTVSSFSHENNSMLSSMNLSSKSSSLREDLGLTTQISTIINSL